MIPGGGQPRGPDYDFYVSRFEVTNDNSFGPQSMPRPTPTTQPAAICGSTSTATLVQPGHAARQKDTLFHITHSRLVYNPNYPLGAGTA